jgi:hypothetical protein
MLLFVLALGVAAAQVPGQGDACVDTIECAAPPPCYNVSCEALACAYTPDFGNCCLTSVDDCCAFASEHQVGVPDGNCSCLFTSSLMCTTDADCDGYVSATLCRAQGACFVPYCELGLCYCLNGTGGDYDDDGVTCPDDCDDWNANVSERITCVRDADDDGSPNCVDSACTDYCVEPNRTCPLGFLAALDRPRSSAAVSLGACAVAPVLLSCDCCDTDAHAYPGSVYASTLPTNCSSGDYDCDNATTPLACCFEPVLSHYWEQLECEPAFNMSTCGGCSTVNGSAIEVRGFACESECTGDELELVPVSAGCPSVCANHCVCTDETTFPSVGECTKIVTECIEVRHGLFADYERCCAIASF